MQLSEELRLLNIRLERGDYGDEIEQARSPLRSQLEQLRAQKSSLEAVYNSNHFKLRQINNQIAQLEDTLSNQQPLQPDAEQLEERAFARSELERKIRTLNEELSLRKAELERTEERERELEAAIARTPEVGIQLANLQREYRRIEQAYLDAVSKRDAAATGEQLEVNRQSERLAVIEQAQVPESPASPNRPKIAAAGMVGSFGLAIALAILLEMLNRAVWSVREMEKRVGIRPLVAVPYIVTETEQRGLRRQFRLRVALVLIAIPLAVVAVDRYYRPIDLLVEQMAEKAGIDDFLRNLTQRIGL